MESKGFFLLFLLSGIGLAKLPAQNSDQDSLAVASHSITITLKPGISFNQYFDFMINKYIPEYEKNFPGSKMEASRNFRSDKETQYFVLVTFKSLKARDMFYRGGSGTSNKARLAWEEMDSINSEGSKYIWDSIRINNDWIIALDEVAVK